MLNNHIHPVPGLARPLQPNVIVVSLDVNNPNPIAVSEAPPEAHTCWSRPAVGFSDFPPFLNTIGRQHPE